MSASLSTVTASPGCACIQSSARTTSAGSGDAASMPALDSHACRVPSGVVATCFSAAGAVARSSAC
jgi:hypothetical protein